jgi:hypothetical protein
MGLPQYNGQYDGQSKTVYFKNTTGGSVTLLEGMALAFDMDNTAAPVSNTSDPKNARGVRVVKPATAVLGGFAGLVDETSAGIVVPDTEGRFITINVPRKGQPVKALVKANATKGVSLLGITNAGGFNLVPHVPGTQRRDRIAGRRRAGPGFRRRGPGDGGHQHDRRPQARQVRLIVPRGS